jgi:Mg2+-importing ATPase
MATFPFWSKEVHAIAQSVNSSINGLSEAVRTRLPFTQSRPSRAMLAVTLAVILVTLWLPYSPLAGLLGFTPLSVPYLLVIFGIVGLYFVSAELTKRRFYHYIKNND